MMQMKTLYRALASGSAASILSAAVVMRRSRMETGDSFTGINAISHWLWGRHAYDQHKPRPRFILPAMVIHHASSIFWATLFERVLASQKQISPPKVLCNAAATSAVACFVDYKMTPARLTPGFEKHLSRASLAGVYVAFGAGLAATVYLRNAIVARRDAQSRQRLADAHAQADEGAFGPTCALSDVSGDWR